MGRQLDFTSRQTKWQCILALVYLPFHLVIIPFAAAAAFPSMDMSMLNFLCYAIGGVFMVVTQWNFLRDDFGSFMEHPVQNALQIPISYALMMCFNSLIAIALIAMQTTSNPNNEAVVERAVQNGGPTRAAVIFLAPIVEECIFRAGLFGLVRKYSRTAAYIVTALVFAVYHVWGYALSDPANWIYLIQYIPVTLLLCRAYERTNSIWGSIFFHMTVNYVSLNAMMMLQELV